MATNYVNCRNCSAQNSTYDGNCRNCGTALPNVGMPMQPAGNFQMQNQMQKPPGADKKLAAGLCGILLGGFGVHKFILGYTNEGVIMLVTYVLGIFLCGIPSFVVIIIGIVEGVMYLTKSDEEFVQTYVVNKKGWF